MLLGVHIRQLPLFHWPGKEGGRKKIYCDSYKMVDWVLKQISWYQDSLTNSFLTYHTDIEGENKSVYPFLSF